MSQKKNHKGNMKIFLVNFKKWYIKSLWDDLHLLSAKKGAMNICNNMNEFSNNYKWKDLEKKTVWF